MLPSGSWINTKATSTLIKTFFIVFFLNLYYTLITYGGRKSNEQQAKSKEQRAKSNKQQAKSNEQEQKVTSNEQKVTNNKQKVTTNEQKVQLHF